MKPSNSLASRVYSITLLCVAVGIAVYGVYFRAVIWPSWPPSDPNDPYGLSDILQATIDGLLFVTCGVCVLSGVWTFAYRATSRRLSICLILTGAVLPFVYGVFPDHMPK